MITRRQRAEQATAVAVLSGCARRGVALAAACESQCGEDNPLWLILRAGEEDADYATYIEDPQEAGSSGTCAAA